MYIKLYESSTYLQLTNYTTYIHIWKEQINGDTSNKHNFIEQTDVNKGKFFSVKSECLHRVRRYFRTLTVAVELYFHPFTFSFPFRPFFSTLPPPPSPCQLLINRFVMHGRSATTPTSPILATSPPLLLGNLPWL